MVVDSLEFLFFRVRPAAPLAFVERRFLSLDFFSLVFLQVLAGCGLVRGLPLEPMCVGEFRTRGSCSRFRRCRLFVCPM